MRLYACVLLLCVAAWAQDVARMPAFEAASIKPSWPNRAGSHFNSDSDRLMAENWTLRSYIMLAYQLRFYQVTGITGWMDTERYDITAKLEEMNDEGLPSKNQLRLRKQAESNRIRTALQTLLAERFGLRFHRETRAMPGFALLISKGGLQLTPVSGGEGPSMNYNDRKLTAKRASMGDVAVFLENQLNQPAADLTHIEGFFDFGLEWSPDELRGAAADSPQGPSIFTALQEQLGLKLQPQKAPVQILVVDSAERPSEN